MWNWTISNAFGLQCRILPTSPQSQIWYEIILWWVESTHESRLVRGYLQKMPYPSGVPKHRTIDWGAKILDKGFLVWFGLVCFYGTWTIVGYSCQIHYIHISSSSSSSSCRAASSDIPDPLSPLIPIVHRLRQVFRTTSRISQSCCMQVRAAHSAFARSYMGVHRSSSLMISSLLLQQCPACLVRLTWIVFVMGGRWLYSWCFVGCCLQDLFNIARSILV